MTGALDARMRATAARLTGTYGKAMTVRVVTRTYNTDTRKTTETTANHAVNGSPPGPVSENRIDGTSIRAGDLQTILPALGLSIVPVAGNRLVVDSKAWEIVDVKPIYSGELVAAYDVVART